MLSSLSKSHILLLSILILFIFFFFSIYKKNIEPFTDSEFYIEGDPKYLYEINNKINKKTERCNAYFWEDSFCQWDEDSNQCTCKYQKDDVKWPFPSKPPCCDRKCSLLPKEKCLPPDQLKNMNYYCNIGGVCLPRTATIRNNRISANNCGTDPLTNQLLLPYLTKEECEKTIDPCDVYNQKFQSQSERKDFCLKDPKCGFCKNKDGEGKCISGTISGPLDLLKYYYCVPERQKADYSYFYGDHAAALLQEDKTP